jgi:hypothetical protein
MVWIQLSQYRAKQRANMKAVRHLGGRAMGQAVSRWRPTAAARVRAQVRSCGIRYGQRHGGRFSPYTSVSPANSHSTDCSALIIYHPGLVQ